MPTPRAAVIHDLSGFGRCSLTEVIPILSVMGVQCCPLPTAFLSTHTGGFTGFTFLDMTEELPKAAGHWKSLDLKFQAIYSGFLGSERQIGIVADFIRQFRGPDTLVVVDPVMGDDWKPYQTYTPAMCAGMERLVRRATIATPNLTEACLLLGEPYDPDVSLEAVADLARRVAALGPEKVVVTGLVRDGSVVNVGYERHGAAFTVSTPQRGGDRSGTGDVFSAIIAADAVNGVPFRTSVERAAAFVGRAIERSIELGIPATDGVAFEEVIRELD